jgi:CheY-like chemotaxis protein
MSQLTNPVILVIDPCGLDLTATASVLNDHGYDVHCAQDRSAALKAAQSLPLDLVICDLAINREQGQCLVEEIRQLPNCVDVPTMFISENQAPDIIRRTDDVGSSYHIRKPFESDVLLELVDKAMWMPHLVNNHLKKGRVNQPHFSFPGSITASTIASQSSMAGQ